MENQEIIFKQRYYFEVKDYSQYIKFDNYCTVNNLMF